MSNQSQPEYPRLIHRIKAIVVDWIVLLILIASISAVFTSIEGVGEQARMIAFIFIFLLYDPLFTSLFGGTIGHMVIGIRIRREQDYGKKIMFPLAIVRFMGKAFLGWISLLTVTGNTERRAIHDYLASSVVIFNGVEYY